MGGLTVGGLRGRMGSSMCVSIMTPMERWRGSDDAGPRQHARLYSVRSMDPRAQGSNGAKVRAETPRRLSSLA